MNRLIERCAMLDIHKSQITACVRVPDGGGGRRQEIGEFVTTTSGLLTLSDWLRSYGVTVVGMESTGVYWRPVYYSDRLLRAARPTARTAPGANGGSHRSARCHARRAPSAVAARVRARVDKKPGRPASVECKPA